ncbi:Uncharacterised protein [Mycobacteroides abscessus]|nr:Uncharacterised protein [Mycobacteroides abscessus]
MSSLSTSRATSSGVRYAWPMTGPTPGAISTSTPASRSGTTMSEKKMPASTRCRRTGWSVISDARSGRRQESSMLTPSRAARYSGSERPAWRMNHTGVISGRIPVVPARRACTSGERSVRPSVRGWPGERATGITATDSASLPGE